MLQHGFDVYPIPDGEIHRFKGPEDNGPNGWYVFHGDHGAFGNWKSGLIEKWSKQGQLSNGERLKLRKKIAASKRRYARKTKARHDRVASEAVGAWKAAKPCIEHPYLSRKGVLSYGLRVQGTYLLVPMCNGQLWSLQKIDPNGSKRFLTGGKVSECYFPIGKPTRRLWLAEGYATAATLHELTGDAVACCFNAGNLPKVAKILFRRLPDIPITVGADNDQAGLEYASHAASIVGGMFVYPKFNDGDRGTDWNDFTLLYGTKFATEVIRGC